MACCEKGKKFVFDEVYKGFNEDIFKDLCAAPEKDPCCKPMPSCRQDNSNNNSGMAGNSNSSNYNNSGNSNNFDQTANCPYPGQQESERPQMQSQMCQLLSPGQPCSFYFDLGNSNNAQQSCGGSQNSGNNQRKPVTFSFDVSKNNPQKSCGKSSNGSMERKPCTFSFDLTKTGPRSFGGGSQQKGNTCGGVSTGSRGKGNNNKDGCCQNKGAFKPQDIYVGFNENLFSDYTDRNCK